MLLCIRLCLRKYITFMSSSTNWRMVMNIMPKWDCIDIQKTIYLCCCHKTVCKAKLSLTLISPLVTEQKKPKLYKLSDQVTEDEILDTKNYGTSEHKCTQCSASKDENGFCDVNRHEKQCFQKVPSTTKVFYMRFDYIFVLKLIF